MRKIKIYTFSFQVFCALLLEGANHRYKVVSGFPSDAVILDCKYNGFSESFDVLVRSNSFEEVRQGSMIPQANSIVVENTYESKSL